MSTEITVYPLFDISEEEEEYLLNILSPNGSEDENIIFEYWNEDEDGDSQDIYSLFESSSDQLMFFVDRKSLTSGDFIVADGRASTLQSEWWVRQTVERYGCTYSYGMYQDSKIRNNAAKSGVPFGRVPGVKGGKGGWGKGRKGEKGLGGIRTVYQSLSSGRMSFEHIISMQSVECSVNDSFSETTFMRHVEQVKRQSLNKQKSSGVVRVDYRDNDEDTNGDDNNDNDDDNNNDSDNDDDDNYDDNNDENDDDGDDGNQDGNDDDDDDDDDNGNDDDADGGNLDGDDHGDYDDDDNDAIYSQQDDDSYY